MQSVLAGSFAARQRKSVAAHASSCARHCRRQRGAASAVAAGSRFMAGGLHSINRLYSTTVLPPSAPAWTSPPAPLAQLLRPFVADAKETSPSLVLHTGYGSTLSPSKAAAGAPADEGTAADPPSSDERCFAVTDVKAFEALICEALTITPVDVPLQPSECSDSRTTKNAVVAEVPSATLLANYTTRELQALLSSTEETLAPLLELKTKIDRFAYDVYLPLLKYGTFALLALQFGVYFNWIFFVFDWNLVEPTTYFLGYTGVFCSLVYHYHRCGEDDFSWKNLFQFLAHREAKKMYAEKKVDAEAVAQLQRRVAAIKAELARMTV